MNDNQDNGRNDDTVKDHTNLARHFSGAAPSSPRNPDRPFSPPRQVQAVRPPYRSARGLSFIGDL